MWLRKHALHFPIYESEVVHEQVVQSRAMWEEYKIGLFKPGWSKMRECWEGKVRLSSLTWPWGQDRGTQSTAAHHSPPQPVFLQCSVGRSQWEAKSRRLYLYGPSKGTLRALGVRRNQQRVSLGKNRSFPAQTVRRNLISFEEKNWCYQLVWFLSLGKTLLKHILARETAKCTWRWIYNVLLICWDHPEWFSVVQWRINRWVWTGGCHWFQRTPSSSALS